MKRNLLTISSCLVCLSLLSIVITGCESNEKKIESLTMQLNDSNIEVRRSAAEKLAKIGKPAIPALMKALDDESEHVHSVAADALVKIGKPAIPALIRSLDKERARETLGRIGKPAVPVLAEMLKDEKEDVRVSRYAADALVKIGKPSVPVLAEMLKDKDGDVRSYAISLLAAIGEPAVPALVKALDSENSQVRAEASWGLVEMGKPAVPVFAEMLKNKEIGIRRYAADALREIGRFAETAVPDLIEALEDDDKEVRKNALWALRKINTPEAIKAVQVTEAKSSEALTILNEIRLSQESYKLHNGTYLNCAPSPRTIANLDENAVPWQDLGSGFTKIGFSTSTSVRCIYQVSSATTTSFIAEALCDVDGDGDTALYVATQNSTPHVYDSDSAMPVSFPVDTTPDRD